MKSIRNSYTMGCSPVCGDYPRALSLPYANLYICIIDAIVIQTKIIFTLFNS